MKWLFASLAALLLAFVPVAAYAQETENDDNFLLRIGADVRIPAGERAGTVVVIDGNAIIEGEVADAIVVISGNAIVSGEVSGDLTVIDGDIELAATSLVKNVTSVRGDIVRAEGATVTGDINERDGFGFLGAFVALFTILFWLGLTLALVAAALLFAAVGGRQLREAAEIMTADAVNVIVGIVFLAVAIPVIAVALMITLIGIPLGIGLLAFLLPALWFLGFIVAGARLGGQLIGLTGRGPGEHPYAAAVLGVVLLQLVVLVPVLGGLVALLAGLWGAGALAVTAFRAAGGRGFAPGGAGFKATHQPAG